MGFFAPGQMADEFYKAASALQKGAISDVLSTQYGFHIIKLTESDDFGLYRDRVAAAVASREVFAELKLKAEAARKKWLAGGDTSSIAAEFGAEVYLSKPINDDAAVDRRIGRPEGLIKELWSMKPGDVGSVFSIPARVYVPRLKGVNPPGVRAFKDCESDAFESCRYYEAHRLAAEDGKKLAALARQKGDFEAAAKELKAGVAVSNLFTRKGNIDDDIRHQPEIIEDAFNMEIGAIGGPKPFGYREFVYQLAERTKPDMGRFDKEKETIRKELEVKQVRPSFSEMVRVRVDALRKQGRVTVNEGMVKNLVEFAKKTPAIRVQPPEPKPKP